ncbi:hypothetical protein [Streptomyces sp. NPDC047000]|uniref:hypothetical protein n=1 Tax=Streptomyces sp. NPDC047000 TaxID=3155474 RepID=UPI00340C0E4F
MGKAVHVADVLLSEVPPGKGGRMAGRDFLGFGWFPVLGGIRGSPRQSVLTVLLALMVLVIRHVGAEVCLAS